MRKAIPKVILVAGASSGVGKSSAILLASRGHTVFGTSRDSTRVNASGVRPLALEVTDDVSVDNCVASVIEATGRLDAVVYSAGHYVAGAVEETTAEQTRDQFEAFVFGAHRLTRAALPHMRAQGAGRLVYMSSSAGAAAIPYHAVYSSSKAALEHYCEGLRYEVEPFGVSVSYIQATGVRTGAAVAVRRSAQPVEAYEPTRERVIGRFLQTQTEGPEPAAIADVIAQAIEAPSPRPVYRVGFEAKMLPWLKALLPDRAFRWQVRRIFSVENQPPRHRPYR